MDAWLKSRHGLLNCENNLCVGAFPHSLFCFTTFCLYYLSYKIKINVTVAIFMKGLSQVLGLTLLYTNITILTLRLGQDLY